MDSLTHIAVGACIGEAFFGRTIGKKAMVWGALAQSVPDIDFIANSWLDTTSGLLAHRGFTHSILFALLVAILLALAAEKWHRPHNITFKKWMLFFSVQLFLHLLLDGFNNYGVGWFEPFSHQRISLNVIYVADPFFSILPGAAFVALLILKRTHPRRKSWWMLGIITGALYLSYCVVNKINMDSDAREITQLQHIPNTSYLTTPTPLNNWLWYVLAGNDSGFYVGYRSVFDTKKEIIGWHNPKERFVFHYFLDRTGGNTLVVQRGRFAKWNRQTTRSLIRRIQGN